MFFGDSKVKIRWGYCSFEQPNYLWIHTIIPTQNFPMIIPEKNGIAQPINKTQKSISSKRWKCLKSNLPAALLTRESSLPTSPPMTKLPLISRAIGRLGIATGCAATYLIATNPVRSLDNQAEVSSGRGTGIADGFFFGRMPKKKRTMLKRLTNSS